MRNEDVAVPVAGAEDVAANDERQQRLVAMVAEAVGGEGRCAVASVLGLIAVVIVGASSGVGAALCAAFSATGAAILEAGKQDDYSDISRVAKAGAAGGALLGCVGALIVLVRALCESLRGEGAQPDANAQRKENAFAKYARPVLLTVALSTLAAVLGAAMKGYGRDDDAMNVGQYAAAAAVGSAVEAVGMQVLRQVF